MPPYKVTTGQAPVCHRGMIKAEAPGDAIFRSLLFLLRILIGEDDKVGKVDVSISVEVKVSLIAGVAPVQAKVLDE